MRNIKPGAKYTSISFTADFISEIKTRVMRDAKYKSIAEFVRDAVREKLEKEEWNINNSVEDKGKTSQKRLLAKSLNAISQHIDTIDEQEMDAYIAVFDKYIDKRVRMELKKEIEY